MLRIALAACALTLLGSAVATDAEACAVTAPHDRALSPDGTAIAADGGVIMTVNFSFGQPRGTLAFDKASGKPTVREIAPLLSVWQPAAGAKAIDLVDGTGKVVDKYTVDAHPPAKLAAPKATLVGTAVAPDPTKPQPPPMGYPNTQLAITLDAAPPADAFALVIYGPKASPRAWVRVDPTKQTYTITTGGKSCMATTAYPSYQGEDLQLAFLDKTGRLSALSKAVRVGK